MLSGYITNTSSEEGGDHRRVKDYGGDRKYSGCFFSYCRQRFPCAFKGGVVFVTARICHRWEKKQTARHPTSSNIYDCLKKQSPKWSPNDITVFRNVDF